MSVEGVTDIKIEGANGVLHNWHLFKGTIICYVNDSGQVPEEKTFLTAQRPPLSADIDMHDVNVMTSEDEVLFSVCAERAVADLFYADASIALQLVNKFIEFGYMSEPSCIKSGLQQITPGKSPLRKKFKRGAVTPVKPVIESTELQPHGLDLLASVAISERSDSPKKVVRGMSAEFRNMDSPSVQETAFVEHTAETKPLQKRTSFKYLPTVLVENLPFVTDIELSEFFNRKAVMFGIVPAGYLSVNAVMPYNSEKESCEVEFVNEYVARFMCSIDTMELKNRELILMQERTLSVEEEILEFSNFATISNLPDNFDLPHCQGFLNQTAWLMDICSEDIPAVKQISHEPGCSSCSVEFINVDVAKKFCIMETLVYWRRLLTLSNDMKPIKHEDKVVCVSNLPKFLYQSNFQRFINETGWLFDIREENVPIVTDILSYDCKTSSCLVEFVDGKVAAAIAAINPLMYDGMLLRMSVKQKPICVAQEESSLDQANGNSVPKEETNENVTACKKTVMPNTKILVENLPIGLTDDDTRASLIFLMVGKKIGSAADIKSFSMHSPTSAIVEFSSHAVAEKTLQLNEVQMFDQRLKVTWSIFDTIDDEFESAVGLDAEGIENVNLEDDPGLQVVGGDSDAEGTEEINTLETDYDCMAFALLCAKYRCDRPTAPWNTIYDLVIGDLERKYAIITNGEQCRIRKKRLDDNYRMRKKRCYGRSSIGWPFFCVVGKFRLDDINCLTAGHNPCDCPSDINKMVKVPSKNIKVPAAESKSSGSVNKFACFTKGSFVTDAGRRALIGTIIDMGLRFEELQKNTEKWRAVKLEMDAIGHNYEPNALKEAFQNLVSKYKSVKEQQIKKSGHGRVDWEYYDDMDRLMRNNVSVVALKTVSVGTSDTVVQRACMVQTPVSSRVGKSRPPSNPRKRIPGQEEYGTEVQVDEPEERKPDWREAISDSLRMLVNYCIPKPPHHED